MAAVTPFSGWLARPPGAAASKVAGTSGSTTRLATAATAATGFSKLGLQPDMVRNAVRLALNVSSRVGIPGDQLHGFRWQHGENPAGEHQTKVLRCWPMPLRLCTVSFQSPTGVRHGVDVEAETLYEAAGIGLARLKGDGWIEGLGPGSRLEIQVREPSTVTP